jgi:Zn-dependent protease with chaperone function
MKLQQLQRIIDTQLADEFGVFGLQVIEYDDDDINASAHLDNFIIRMSPSALALPRPQCLAILAHEVAHLICYHHNHLSGHFIEYEADRISVEVLEHLGLTKLAIAKLMADYSKVLKKEFGDDIVDLDSETHPSINKRIEAIDGLERNRS